MIQARPPLFTQQRAEGFGSGATRSRLRLSLRGTPSGHRPPHEVLLPLCFGKEHSTHADHDLAIMVLSPSQRFSPGQYREDEYRQEDERHHGCDHEVFIAPGGQEEGNHHGGTKRDGQGEKEGRAHKIRKRNTAATTLKAKNASAADLESAR